MTRRLSAEDLTAAQFKAIREALGLTPAQFALARFHYDDDAFRAGVRPEDGATIEDPIMAEDVVRFESGEKNISLTVPQMAIQVARQRGVLDRVLSSSKQKKS